ncbi:MAG: type II toxin-antitoxin system RelE/ParE family toxin [Cyclobacteriaceae bacterium]|jgi:phage-related protein|nr:type II toxin-antitoxin system RelE/ParE family toxin [Cyclobacteriaceae bacterium]
MDHPLFEIELLPDVVDFLERLDGKTREKIYYSLKKSQFVRDRELFKKLTDHIWEFRTLYRSRHYRLLAFWDKSTETVVVATHGFVKKTGKTPGKEIERAEEIRRGYFNSGSKTRKI